MSLTVAHHTFFGPPRTSNFYEVYEDEELTLYWLNASIDPDLGTALHAYNVQLHVGATSPYLATYVDEGAHEQRPFLLVQSAPGSLLSALVTRAGGDGPHAPVELVTELARQTGHALDALGSLEVDGAPCGLVHGAISPECIHVGFDGRVRLRELEFSQSVLAPAQDDGVVIGRPGYFAPEHLEGTRVAEGDLFSLALCLVAFSRDGESPMHADSPMKSIMRLQEFSPSDLNLTGPLAPVIERCLAKDTSMRFRSAAAFVSALPELRADLGGWAAGVLG